MSNMLLNVRLSFPHLFKKEAFDAKATPKFGAMFIVDKNNPGLKELKAEMKAVMMEKWGERPEGLIIGLHDGSKKSKLDGFDASVVYFNASSEKRPNVFDADKTPLTDEDGRPYAGCYVNARVTPWAQDNKYGKRINFELNGVQFSKDGDAFGGGGAPSTSDEFPELEPQESEYEGEVEVEAVADDDSFLD